MATTRHKEKKYYSERTASTASTIISFHQPAKTIPSEIIKTEEELIQGETFAKIKVDLIRLLDNEEIDLQEGMVDESRRQAMAERVAKAILHSKYLTESEKIQMLDAILLHSLFEFRNSPRRELITPRKRSGSSPELFHRTAAQCVLMEAKDALECYPRFLACISKSR